MHISILIHDIDQSKTRSHLTDSKLKNFLLLSVTNLAPNIENLVKCLIKSYLKSNKFHVYLLLYQILHLYLIILPGKSLMI